MSVEPISEQLHRIREKAEARQLDEARMVRRPPVDESVAQRVAEVKQAERLRQQWEQLVPTKYHDAAPEDFDAKAVEGILRWRDGSWHDGVNLLITGPVGSGKTRAAFAAAAGPFAAGASVGFWPEAELKDALDWRNPEATTTVRAVCRVGVLILDDLGIDAPNDWWSSKLYAVVNRRWLEDLPTIATTNLGPKELLEAVGPRTYSRLADHPIGVRVTGEDRRRAR